MLVLGKVVLCVFLIIVEGQQGPCPASYPPSCKCFPKPKWVKCENLQALTDFPRDVFNNDTKWLSLEKSSIANLTIEDFRRLPSLTELYMTDGKLSSIQAGTFQQLQNLRIVDLAGNQLSGFPLGVFANLSKLEDVRLGKNPFEVLAIGMFLNSPLKALSLKRSRLNATGLNNVGVGGVAKHLEKLILDESNINLLAREQFSGLPNLDSISLYRCSIQYVQSNVLKGTKVATVDLFGNPIMKINSDAFKGEQFVSFKCRYCGLNTEKVFGNDSFILQMSSLEQLDLGHNDIAHVPKDAFKGLSKLSTLLLFNNNISTIEENPFTVFPKNKRISFGIQVNPFKCDCHLAWFHSYSLKNIDNAILRQVKCATPAKLFGKNFQALKTSEFCCETSEESPGRCGEVNTVRPTSGQRSLLSCLFMVMSLAISIYV